MEFLEFVGRFAVALADIPSLIRQWPQMQVAVAAGAVADFSVLRFRQAKELKEALARAVLLAVILEVLVAFLLSFFQAWFYWSPK
jgi:uncharacterized membrane protein YbjE (DUF340 family)